MRGDPILCEDCRECVAQTTRWAAGRKRDLCDLCALAYDGPSWSVKEDTLASMSRVATERGDVHREERT